MQTYKGNCFFFFVKILGVIFGVFIVKDSKKKYCWCPVKSIYPFSIFFLYSGPEVVPRWSRSGPDSSGYGGRVATGRSLHSLQDARFTSWSTLCWSTLRCRCVSLRLGCVCLGRGCGRQGLWICKKKVADLATLCRDEATRTPDPYVPNVVRYQLRYIPIFIFYCLF